MRSDPGKKKRWLCTFALVVYGAMLMWLLLGRRMGTAVESRINLQPLDTVKRYLWVLEHSRDSALNARAKVNLVGNALLFVPAGVLLPWAFVCLRRGFRLLLFSAVWIWLVELLQLRLGLGSCDVDDLLLNLLGLMAGFCLWTLGSAVHYFAKKE